MEFPPAYASLIFPMVITCYFAANSFFPQTHSSLKTIFMLWLRFQISAASQSSHPDWVVAKIYLQRENYTWDSTSHEHSAFTSASLKHVSSSRDKDWVISALGSQDFTKLRVEESRRAESCCNRGSAAEEWHCQLLTPSSSSAAAENCTCSCIRIPQLIWSGFTIILLEKKYFILFTRYMKAGGEEWLTKKCWWYVSKMLTLHWASNPTISRLFFPLYFSAFILAGDGSR